MLFRRGQNHIRKLNGKIQNRAPIKKGSENLDLLKLDEPFAYDDLEWRVQRTIKEGFGVIVPYVTARAIMSRLDDVVGKENWRCEYEDIPNNGVACTIYIKCGDEWVGKEDAAQCTHVEPVKGGRSAALKRAAVAWGIGRYLYELGEVKANLKGKFFKGKVILPDEYLPEKERTGNHEIKVVDGGNGGHSNGYQKPTPKKFDSEESKAEAIEAAKNVVVEGDKFNSGKKLGDLWKKAAEGIVRFNRNANVKEAAQLLLDAGYYDK